MLIENRKAHFEFNLLKRFEAGMVLNGALVKEIRGGKIDMERSFGKFIKGELFLVNVTTSSGAQDSIKLLLHKKELDNIKANIQAKKLTIVPVKMYNSARVIKLEIALAKHKRKHEKREKLKRRDIDREIRNLKHETRNNI